MTVHLLALLLAFAQSDKGAAPPDQSTSSNVSDKAQALPSHHPTELQGTAPKRRHGKRAKAAAKSMPEASPASTPQKPGEEIESSGGKGKRSPKPLGEKANQ